MKTSLRENEDVEQFYTCVYCDQPVVREGTECYDCRKGRPDVLQPERAELDEPPRRPWIRLAVAFAVVAVGLFLLSLRGLGAPEGQRWSADVGAAVTALASVPDQCVVVADRAGMVRAFDEVSGAERWSFATDARGDPAAVAVSDLVIDAGTVFFHDGLAELVALDLRTGKLRWRTAFEHSGSGITPVVTEHEILLTRNDLVVAFHRDTGWRSWSVPVGEGTPRALALAGDGDLALIGLATDAGGREGGGGGVCALHLESAAVTWSVPLDCAVRWPPLRAGHDEGVVVAFGATAGASDPDVLVGVRPGSPDAAWRRSGAVFEDWAWADGVLFVIERVGRGAGDAVPERTRVVALAARDGSELWTAERDDAVRLTLAGATVYRREAGALCPARAKTGSVRWTRALRGEPSGGLAVGSRTLFCATRDGTLRALTAR